ncbi:FAD binding domain-containing protein [Leptodontidium sp. MPI-SDFR-AT-0119]|nr:FAD binding domain-containing protein [Leptodontidium sp. MPI-SDFR-AT-0119]
MDQIINVPIIIIGGGGCGLTLSSFLSDWKVQHVLFEKHSGTSLLPKAHYLNQRTMETFRHHGLDKPVLAVGAPIHNMGRVQWKTSLGGDGAFDGRVLGHCGAFGGDFGTKQWEDYRRDSPSLSSNVPLLRLEPILRQLAEDRNPGHILFGHTVADLEDDSQKVIATVQKPDGKTQKYQAQYVVCADGGKFSTPKLGINMEGPTGLVDFVSTHFKADLSEYWDDRTLITHFINPEGEKMVNFDCGALVQMGPTWGRKSEEWTLHFGFPVTDSSRFDKEALPPRIRQLLKLPDLEMEVLNISHWVLDRVLADKYKVGRVFIAGDAAHRRPPTTGLGLNTSIEDARNIAWKLAAVLNRGADVSLLETYETERRPIGLRNCDWGLFTFSNMAVLQAAVGLVPGAVEYNNERFRRIFEDSFYGQTARNQIQRAISTQDIEFTAHDLELGFVYEKGAVLFDGSKPPPVDPAGQTYISTTRPGHRLPHSWIEDKKGDVVSTQDLLVVGKHDFFLITDEDGDAWISAATSISKLTSLSVGAAKIRAQAHSKGDGLYYDYQDQWSKVREIGNGGAILVRPDNFVAWRRDRSCDDPELELASVFAQLMNINPRVANSNENCSNGVVHQ